MITLKKFNQLNINIILSKFSFLILICVSLNALGDEATIFDNTFVNNTSPNNNGIQNVLIYPNSGYLSLYEDIVLAVFDSNQARNSGSAVRVEYRLTPQKLLKLFQSYLSSQNYNTELQEPETMLIDLFRIDKRSDYINGSATQSGMPFHSSREFSQQNIYIRKNSYVDVASKVDRHDVKIPILVGVLDLPSEINFFLDFYAKEILEMDVNSIMFLQEIRNTSLFSLAAHKLNYLSAHEPNPANFLSTRYKTLSSILKSRKTLMFYKRIFESASQESIDQINSHLDEISRVSSTKTHREYDTKDLYILSNKYRYTVDDLHALARKIDSFINLIEATESAINYRGNIFYRYLSTTAVVASLSVAKLLTELAISVPSFSFLIKNDFLYQYILSTPASVLVGVGITAGIAKDFLNKRDQKRQERIDLLNGYIDSRTFLERQFSGLKCSNLFK